MTDPATAALVAALRERLSIISDHTLRDHDPSRQLSLLQDVSARIAELGTPFKSDPQIAHYLDRCSYDKLLAALTLKPD